MNTKGCVEFAVTIKFYFLFFLLSRRCNFALGRFAVLFHSRPGARFTSTRSSIAESRRVYI